MQFGVKVAQTWKPENDTRPTIGPGQSLGHGSIGPKSHISFWIQAVLKDPYSISEQLKRLLLIANNCFEKMIWMSKVFKAINHCDKYTPYPLFVTKDKTTQRK